MSTDKQVKANTKIWESASKRPLPGTNIDDVLKLLEETLHNIQVRTLDEAMPTPMNIDDVFDELHWVANRWRTFESGLMRIAQGTTTRELETILEERSDVLFWLMDRSDLTVKPTNEEIIALCKQSNNPKFINTLTFTIPPGYKGGNPTKLMSNALQAIETYERNYGPYVPEPEYLIEKNQEDGTIRRFINPEWIDWWCNYSDRNHHPIRVAEDRVRERFSDRKLKNLDIRTKEVTDPEVLGDPRPHHEIFVTYEASI